MPETRLDHETDFEGWREAARRLLALGVRPEDASWRVGDAQPGLFDGVPPPPPPPSEEGCLPRVPAEPRVPLRFVLLAKRAALHADAGRWSLLYKLLWRIVRGGERRLLERPTDGDVARLEAMARAVDREAHRLKAFLRFKEVWTRAGPRYVAWFEPEHYILELCAPFLAQRFTAMRWLVVTPYRSAHWDGDEVVFGPGGSRADVPAEDARDEDWRAYYAAAFDPARANPALMRRHVPARYRRDMPETRAIPALVAGAAARTGAMLAPEPAAPPPPARAGRVIALPHRHHRSAPGAVVERPATLEAAREAAAACRACPLWEPATRTVFGEGPRDARVMLVGEQPGDWEDLEGRPFVGPAGQLLDRALAEAGLDRSRFYLTNAVKHFKFAPRGKRRIHQKPDGGEVEACGAWLALERELVRPRLIVALGATAARALTGRDVKVGEERGRVVPLGPGAELLVTVHPSYVLRLPDAARQADEYARLAADLRLAAPYLGGKDATAAA